MTDVPQLEGPKLLVEWSSRWDEFVSSIGPAMGRSPRRLAGEARTDIFPYRGVLLGWFAEIMVLVALAVLPAKLASLRPYVPPPLPKYDVIYFSGDELPRTEDTGGAQAGRTGAGGGREAYHRTQTIRVARGPSVSEKIVEAPKLNLPKSDNPVANLLAYKAIPGPAPAEGLKSSTRSISLPQTAVVAPSPQVSSDRMRTAPALSTSVVAPAPAASQLSAARSLTAPSVVSVVPPAVSAPERDSNVAAKLTLPAQVVIAPPPTHVTRELGSLGGAEVGDFKNQVVPPPVQAGTRSLDRTVAGGLTGNSQVVPPPVQAGTRSMNGTVAGGLVGTSQVIPPPVQGSGATSLFNRVLGSLIGTTDVVPPAPSVGGGTSANGTGSGSKGNGYGAAMDLGSVSAPPGGGGGTGGGKGLVVSSQPGTTVGIPGSGGTGSLAMSPSGLDKAGLGGSGGGAGIGHGTGPGSGLSGEGSGAGREGKGPGSDPAARGGISPYPGTGGAGRGTTGSAAVPGVSVAGGSTINLPSFGANGNDPNLPGRSATAGGRRALDITVVGTSRSGGAFNFYGALKGDKVYTIYIDTGAGTAVMQFADPSSANHAYTEDLTAPEPMRAELPGGLHKSRLVLACILDRSGQLKNVQVLERGGPEMTNKILASLPNWKFRPVLRSNQPVEVNAILGFNIDTR
jgi:hypothetical protein